MDKLTEGCGITHELKLRSEFFAAVVDLKRQFDIRQNDRDYRVGDTLQLWEWLPEAKTHTGEYVIAEITFVTDFEQKPGYVVLGIDVFSMPDLPLCIKYSTIKGATIERGEEDKVNLYFESAESANECYQQLRHRRFAESR